MKLQEEEYSRPMFLPQHFNVVVDGVICYCCSETKKQVTVEESTQKFLKGDLTFVGDLNISRRVMFYRRREKRGGDDREYAICNDCYFKLAGLARDYSKYYHEQYPNSS